MKSKNGFGKAIGIVISVFVSIWLISWTPWIAVYPLLNIKVKRNENNTLNKFPIINIEDTDQKIDFSELISKDELKTIYKNVINNEINQDKLNYYFDKYNLKIEINQSIDESFDMFLNSEEFLKLYTSNDINILKNNLISILISNKSKFQDNIATILSSKIKWNYNFVSLLFKDQITFDSFEKINNEFYDLFDKDTIKNFISSSLDSLKTNDKYKWLLNQANASDQQISNLIDKYVDNQILNYQSNYLNYQKLLFQMNAFDNLKDINNISEQTFNNWNSKEAQIKKCLYDITSIVRKGIFFNWNDDSFMWYTFNLWEKNIYYFAYKNINFFDYIKKLFLLIKDDLFDINNPLYNKEIVDLLNDEIIIKMINYMSTANEDSLYEFKDWMNDNINSIKHKLDKFDKLISKRIAFLFNIIFVLFANNHDQIYYLFNNEYLLKSDSYILIDEILKINNSIDTNKEWLIYSKVKDFLTSITNKEYKTNQEMILDLSLLNISSIINYLYDNKNDIESVCKNFGYDYSKFENYITRFKEFANIIENLINNSWKFTLLPNLNSPNDFYGLVVVVSNTIMDKNILDNVIGNLNNLSVQQTKEIIKIIISPHKGLEDIINYCKDNNIVIKNIS